MTPGVVTAGSGQPWESDLVTSLERPGAPMTVVRRCADMGEVLAASDALVKELDTRYPPVEGK